MLEPHKNLSPFGAPISTLDEWLALERFKTWDLYANNMGYAGASLAWKMDVRELDCLSFPFISTMSLPLSGSIDLKQCIDSLVPNLSHNLLSGVDLFLDCTFWMGG
jgi:hypothetical protein